MATLRYEQKLNSIREVLLEDWDPIGIGSEPSAQDEYDGYLPAILGLLQKPSTMKTLARHLTEIATLEMGLVGDQMRDRAVAERLLRLRLE